MAGLSFDAARREVRRGKLAAVYYLTGPEDILKDEMVSAIVDAAVDPSSRDFNLDLRSAGDLDGETLHALIETPPLLATRRVVVVRGLEQWRRNAKVWDVLRRYLMAPSPTTVLVLLHAAPDGADPAIAAQATHVVLERLTPDELTAWAATTAQAAGLLLDPAALAHLLHAVGQDLAQAASEIAKLAAAIGGDRAVTVEEVAAFVGIRHGETQRDWVEAVAARDAVRAAQLVDIVLPQAGVTAVRMVAALGTELVGLRLAVALAEQGMTGPRLRQALFQELRTTRPPGMGDWGERASQWAATAARWTGPDLDRAIEAAYAADVALKSTTVSDERGILRGLVLSLHAREVAA
ncbi:MAG TPA: DNA polymerase III subunit delta [Gemmatimonadales bacterium]